MREVKFKYLANVEGIDGELDWGEKVMTLEEIGWGEWEDYLSACFTTYPDNIYILQYTGLKDKNGVEVYDGDIIKITDSEYALDENDDIVWDKDGGCVYIDQICYIKCEDLTYTKAYFDLDCKKKWDNGHTYGDWSDEWTEQEFEVIGNIYENPDLLS